MMEHISVVVPVFNTEDYLSRCIDSIISQTYTNLDIILVDDGSTDKSGDICDRYAAQVSSVRVIHQENGGVSHARNVGISLALGEYICFVDADDAITPDYLELLHKILKNADCDISTCGTVYVYDMESRINSVSNHNDTVELMSGIQAVESMLYQKKITNSPFAKLYKKELFDTIKFDKKLAIAEDLDINYKLFLKANKVAINSSQNYLYLQRPGSVMQSLFSIKRIDGLTVAKRLLSNAKMHHVDLVNSAKNRLFVEAILIASEIPHRGHSYRKEFNECVKLISSLGHGIVSDNESRLRFRFYAGISLINVRILILFFVAKRFPKKLYLNLAQRL